MKKVSVTMFKIFLVQLYKCPKIKIILIFCIIIQVLLPRNEIKNSLFMIFVYKYAFFTILAIKGRRESAEPMNFNPSLIHHISGMCPKSQGRTLKCFVKPML